MKQLRRGFPFLFLIFLLLAPLYFLLPIPSESSDPLGIDVLAPVELLADGFGDLRGVAVDESGRIHVADRSAGTVTRINPDGSKIIVASRLERPIGIAFDSNDRLLIAEERAGRVVRLEENGTSSSLVEHIKQPRWLAFGEDGTLFISARRLTRDADLEPDDESIEPEVILALNPAGQLRVFADGFRHLQGLAVSGDSLYAAARGLKNESKTDGVVFKIPIKPDGSGGPLSRHGPSDSLKKPVGLAVDTLGALYVSTKEIELDNDKSKRAVGKLFADGQISLFASRLQSPHGLALAPSGDLILADGNSGRVVRFRAPAPPILVFPSFTNQSPLTVHGTTQSQSRIDAFLNNSVTPTFFTQDGAFALILNLLPNSQNSLIAFTTAQNGLGLTSGPVEAVIVHDNIPPVVSNLLPLNGSFHNTRTPFIGANFSDNLAGIDTAKVQIQLDGTDVTLQAQVTESGFTLKPLNPLSEGLRTVSATILDRAGNSALASTTFTVDVTPPETLITGGPEGTISATSVVFTVSGSDNLTPTGSLEFSWHLDSGPFSPFSSQTQVSLSNLTPGPHTFEVKARDLAGNEDPIPATRTFTISTLQVLITEPAHGVTVVAGSLLVRGTVEAGGAEVGVTINGFPAAVQGNNFAALVPVTSDTTTLTAVATTAAGAIASHSVNISVVAATAPVFALLPSPRSGVAPLTVSFSLLGGTAISSVELDFDGDGTVDFTGASLDGQTFTYMQPGIYVPTVTVTDTQGNRLTASAVGQVFDRTALDTMLQAKWTGMKDVLRGGNITAALTFIALSARSDYEELFLALQLQLGNIDEMLKDISLVLLDPGYAQYQAIRVDDGIRLSYFVLFVLDEDGIWRLKFF